MAMCITAATLLVFSLSLLAVPSQGIAEFMKMPIQRQSWSYPAQDLPWYSLLPEQARPVGVGHVATGGTLISINVSLPQFPGPVDVYGAYTHTSSSDRIFMLQDNLEFRPLTVDAVNRALTTGVISPVVVPWLGGVTGPVDENPLTLSTSLAPSGEYTIYLLVAPAGSLEAYYLWETRFTISAPAVSNRSITLTWDPPTTNSDGTPLTDLAGFKVYHGAATRHYTRSVNAGNVRSLTLSDLSPGTHYFSVTAYDISGNESTFSNEVNKTLR